MVEILSVLLHGVCGVANAVETLKAEIAKKQREIATLQSALDVLSEGSVVRRGPRKQTKANALRKDGTPAKKRGRKPKVTVNVVQEPLPNAK